MRNRSFATLGLLALLAAASAFGQPRLKADIPFEFRVGTTVMPAGQYYVNPDFGAFGKLLSLDCHECRAKAVVVTHSVSGNEASTEGRLVFNKYGDTYFLSAVWLSDRRVGSGLQKDKTERELAGSASLARTSLIVLALR